MPFPLFREHPYLTLAAVSFLVNIPLGYIRENCPKFSLKWLFWIHASIPLIIYLRIILGTSTLFIPVSIFLAVIGQGVGGSWCGKTMSVEDRDRLKQISSFSGGGDGKVNVSETTVVLLNMGGPRTLADIRDFQKRLFSDSRLIRFPLSFVFQKPFAWLLACARGRAARKRYQLIGGGSPILESTQNQATALQEELKKRKREADVTFCFNYSPPFPAETLEAIKGKGRRKILFLSLYPHYSQATTGSSIYHFREAARDVYPEAEFLNAAGYYLHDGYIEAFVERIHEQMRPGESLEDFYLIFSAHSLPLYFLTEGDPYPFQISQTTAKILTRLGRTAEWVISYQSAVGPLQWLKPSTEDVIEALIRRGFKKLLIVPVSFVTDHIETLCEINIEYRQFAEKLGVEDFRMSRAVECHPAFVRALADTVEAALA